MTKPAAPYLLSGSFAFDTIMHHPGAFASRIQADALDKLSVAFGVQPPRKMFGGTGGNIAYNASLLGQAPLLIAMMGNDGQEYVSWLRKQGHDTSSLTQAADLPTAHAYICGDMASNQITFFSKGAMDYLPEVPFETPHLWHLAPDSVKTTAYLAHQAIGLKKKFFFDPGQALPGFLDARVSCALDDILRAATGIFVNDYEAEILIAATGVPLEHWLCRPDDFIVRTHGGDGVTLTQLSSVRKFGVAPAQKIVDATGCGDALRAGFLFGYAKGFALDECVQIGAAMGSFAIEHVGGQVHRPHLTEVQERRKAMAPGVAHPPLQMWLNPLKESSC